MPYSTDLSLASSISDGARRVHWSGIRDRRSSRIVAEKDWCTSCMKGMCLVFNSTRKAFTARSHNNISDVRMMSTLSGHRLRLSKIIQTVLENSHASVASHHLTPSLNGSSDCVHVDGEVILKCGSFVSPTRICSLSTRVAAKSTPRPL
jgi:hypothetical protein